MSEETATEEITLSELLELAAAARLLDVHTSMPAQVVNYYYKTQTVDVQPLLNRAVPDGNGGFVSEALPQLLDVPVRFPRCRQFTITFPLIAGDCGRLVFSERSIAAWRTTGSQSDPGDVETHGLDGATFDPGLDDDNHAAQTADIANMVIGSDDKISGGNSRIVISPTAGIQLGEGATKGVVRKGDATTGHTHTATFALTAGMVPVTGTITIVSATDTMNGCSANIKAVD